MSLLTSCRSAGDIRCALHHLIDDETLSLIILFDLDVPTTLSCDDRRVKSKLLFIRPEKPEDCGHELQLKPRGCDTLSRSNSHSRMSDPQRVKPKTKRRLS